MTYIPTYFADAAGSLTVPGTAPDIHELVRAGGVRVIEYHCRAGRDGHATAASYDCHTLVAVRRGTFCYADHGYTRLLEPGALVLGCPGDAYTSSHEYGCGDVCTVFQFTAEVWARLQADVGRAVMPRATAFVQAPHLEAMLPSQTEASTALFGEERAYRLAAVLASLGNGMAEVPPSLRRADRERAHAAAQYMEEHAADELALDELAAIARVSPFHFLRLFRQELGLTPHQYLIRTRLRQAIALLLDTRLSVTEIALAVGFGDHSHFTRTFRRQVGCSPEAYRRAA